VVEESGKIAQHSLVAIAGSEHSVDEIGSGKLQEFLRDRLRVMAKKVVGIAAQQVANRRCHMRASMQFRPFIQECLAHGEATSLYDAIPRSVMKY
jgi:hypothetical protein